MRSVLLHLSNNSRFSTARPIPQTKSKSDFNGPGQARQTWFHIGLGRSSVSVCWFHTDQVLASDRLQIGFGSVSVTLSPDFTASDDPIGYLSQLSLTSVGSYFSFILPSPVFCHSTTSVPPCICIRNPDHPIEDSSKQASSSNMTLRFSDNIAQ